MIDLFEWTSLFPRSTGLPVTIWISVKGIITTNSYNSNEIGEHTAAVSAWIELNRETLSAYWRGDIDGKEMCMALLPLSKRKLLTE